MEERSTANVILMFFVVPIPAGLAILIAMVANVMAHGRTFTAMDWLGQVVWFGLLGLGLMTCLPAAGRQELQRWRQLREAEVRKERVEAGKKPGKRVKKPVSDLDDLF